MKKTLVICSILLVIVMFNGCTLFDRTPTTNQTTQPTPVVDLFNYDGLEYHQDQILIRTAPGVDLDKLVATEKSTIVKEWSQIGWALITVPQGEQPTTFINKLRKQQGVILAEPNMKYQLDTIVPTAERYAEQWGLNQIRTEAGWNITTGNSNVIVAILDTGVDTTHPEFFGKQFIGAYDTTHSSVGVYDQDGHGTHVAGIAADDGRTGKIAGVAWDCPIMPVKIVDDNGEIYTDYLITALVYIADYVLQNPTYRIVANMSLDGQGYNFSVKEAIDYAASVGILVVTSAGNEGKSRVNFPAAYNGVVSVAATTPYEVAAKFSNSGYYNSISAPGTRILSTYPIGDVSEGYEYLDGTSVAAPFVTGAAALLLSTNASLTPIQIKNQLEQTARGNGFTEALGYGILDVEALLGSLQPMLYGGLNVTSNLTRANVGENLGTGVITVFDEMNSLVAFGTTGSQGNHLFSALKAGTYTVNLSFYDLYKSKYVVQTQTAYVEADRDAMIYFNIPQPSQVIRTLAYSEDMGDGTTTEFETNISISTAGLFEFETLFYVDYCDPVLEIYNESGMLIADNDDYRDEYPYLTVFLETGMYTVRISEYSGEPLWVHLNIYSTQVVY